MIALTTTTTAPTARTVIRRRRTQRELLFILLVALPLASPFSIASDVRVNARRIGTAAPLSMSLSPTSASSSNTFKNNIGVPQSSWASDFGDSALRNVQGLASRVATGDQDEQRNPASGSIVQQSDEKVWSALQSLEQDMSMLDRWVVRKPQLSPLEFALLSMSVVAAGAGPLILNGEVTELLAPAAAAFSAAIGIGAEYVAKVAVADGKEVAAATVQCAAEAEGYLANAERAKAVTPLCVGVGATAASFALLIPVLLASLEVQANVQLVTEIYLLCPLLAILAAAVCSLALEETKSFCQRAISVGNRRFSKAGLVGRTWLSSTEQINLRSRNALQKWQTFALSVFPAPFIGALVPGTLPTKAIVVTATAAAQTAYYLAQAEFSVSRATDAVALKSRSAAVCDTYANQGARSAAILPFTSALASLCAAATAAIVELPLLEALAGTTAGTVVQIGIVSTFPACSALLAGAASVSKARCEVDTEAATQAASTLALEYTDKDQDPVLQPFRGVVELIKLMGQASVLEPLRRRFGNYWIYKSTANFVKWVTEKWRPPSSDRLALGGL